MPKGKKSMFSPLHLSSIHATAFYSQVFILVSFAFPCVLSYQGCTSDLDCAYAGCGDRPCSNANGTINSSFCKSTYNNSGIWDSFCGLNSTVNAYEGTTPGLECVYAAGGWPSGYAWGYFYIPGGQWVSPRRGLECPQRPPSCRPGWTGTKATTGQNISNCTQCVPGEFKSMWGFDPCTTCRPGKYAPGEGASTCANCPSATYSEAVGATSQSACMACPPNTVSQGSRCECLPGWTGQNNSTRNCTMCEAGKFKQTAGSVACTDCEQGKYSGPGPPGEPQTVFKYYPNLGWQGEVVTFLGNDYRTLDGTSPTMNAYTGCQNYWIPLPSGWGLAEDNEASRKVIESNYWGTHGMVVASGNGYWTAMNSYRGLSITNGLQTATWEQLHYMTRSCNFRILITNNLQPAGTFCTTCPSGTFSEVVGATSGSACMTCPNNTVSQGNRCECSPGWTGANNSTRNCTLCEAGKFKETAGPVACADCEAGKYSGPGPPGEPQTVFKYYPNLGWQGEVVTFLGNDYRTLDGTSPTSTYPGCQNYGIPLPSGWGLAEDNEASRKVIESNYWGTHGMVVASGNGYWTAMNSYRGLSITNGLQTTTWEQLHYMTRSCNFRILITNNLQPAGTFCRTCPSGTFSEVVGATSGSACMTCPNNTVSQGNRCECWPGWTGANNSTRHCTLCVAGKFKPTTGSAPCILCEAGKYSEQLAAQYCINCGGGKYGVQVGAQSESTCINCTAGSHSNAYTEQYSTSQCWACEAGKFSNSSGSSRCRDCQLGKYGGGGNFSNATANATVGNTDCVTCAAGKYGMKSYCACFDYVSWFFSGDYWSWYYCQYYGHNCGEDGGCSGRCFVPSTCVSCPPNTDSPPGSRNVADCSCNAGWTNINVYDSTTTCKPCETGKFMSVTNGTVNVLPSCIDCPAGKYAAREGATACTTCEQGKYSCSGADMCITFVAAETSECCTQLGSEFEKLKQQVMPLSSFMPTDNRTMPAWGNSSYSRCQLPFSWTELIKGYKESEIMFRTGGLGRHMQVNLYEVWVCMDHYCGDPVFCWVYHEIDKVFTAWGPNSKLLLITEL